jgi:hypothetical protein
MPTTIIVNSLEVALMRCRKQVATRDEELLLYLIDIMLLHLRRQAADTENNSTTEATKFPSA